MTSKKKQVIKVKISDKWPEFFKKGMRENWEEDEVKFMDKLIRQTVKKIEEHMEDPKGGWPISFEYYLQEIQANFLGTNTLDWCVLSLLTKKGYYLDENHRICRSGKPKKK